MPQLFLRARRWLALFFVAALGGLSTPLPGRAQGWLGISASNYGGTNALYLNPAAIVDTRYKLYVNIVGADANFYNNYLRFSQPYSLWQITRNKVPTQYRDRNNNYLFKDSYISEELTGRTKYANLSLEARLPSAMLTLPHNQAVALSSRVRAMVQFNNVSENVARLSRYGLEKAGDLGLAFKALDDSRFSFNVNTYQEIAGTYARALTPNGPHFWKVGVTLKYLVGLGGGYVNNQGLGYVVYDGDSIQLRDRKVEYGYTDYTYYGSRNDFRWTQFYGQKRLGRGLGLDAGLSYEWRPDWQSKQYEMDGEEHVDGELNKYKLRLGLAISDLGRVKYQNERYISASRLAPNATVQLGSLDTLSFRSLQHVDQLVSTLAGVDQRVTTFKSQLPRTLHLTADYHLKKNLYLGATWQQNLLSQFAIGTRTFSSIALVPRIEKQKFEFALPLTLADDYHRLQVGAMVRVGPAFLGSDNLGGMFGASDFSGYDLYAGASFALFHHKPKDRDRDGASDQRDPCPDVAGVWEFKGCPDRDRDHVADFDDKCPDDPGLKEFKGCPDRDGDQIIDRDDACPDAAGLAEFQGCPDRDNDKITDAEDMCPDKAGPLATRGCPDRDNDGLADAEDLCPDKPGLKAHFGCPDTDADSVYDHQDLCIEVAGPVANKGCPWPDADGDGVNDKDDDCPQTAGDPAHNGCPVLAKAEEVVLRTAFSNLEFETNRAVIRPSSYPSLNELAHLLQERPTARLRLWGHTDNVGSPEFNLRLSLQRAESVKSYLERQGVPAERMFTEGFGRTIPVASNRTAAGRARNRRVEMKVLFD